MPEGSEQIQVSPGQRNDFSVTSAQNTDAVIQESGAQQSSQNFAQFFQPVPNQPRVKQIERLWAGISYLPFLAILPLILYPKSQYIRLHGRQGLLLSLFFFFCLFLFLVPFIGVFVGGLCQFFCFFLGLYSLYQAFIGNWWKIPVFGEIAQFIPLDLFSKLNNEIVHDPDSDQLVTSRSFESQDVSSHHEIALENPEDFPVSSGNDKMKENISPERIKEDISSDLTDNSGGKNDSFFPPSS